MRDRNPRTCARRLRRIGALTAAAVALLPGLSLAAVPGEVNYQGLLLDSGGQPVTGPVDLVFRLFDVESGGTSLWSESHDDVDVLDGVYHVTLGSVTPLTSLVLGNDVLYLEVEVEGEILAPRPRLLAVPYAIRADSADNVGGLPAVYATEVFEHFAFDGGPPDNDDPSEGVGDTDADGIPNFIDPDNDDDGTLDVDELTQGSDINLVTPSIEAFDPPVRDGSNAGTVQIQGKGFLPGLSVVFGTESPTPMNVTSTSFDVEVGPQSGGAVSVVVTNPNAEADSANYTFDNTKRVFVASAQSDGDLGGLTGADATCNAAAAAGGLSGSFLAWLADDTDSPATRLSPFGGPYLRVDDVKIADDWADLTDGSLDALLEINEFGTDLGPSWVWTNVDGDGTATGSQHCTNWTSSAGDGRRGGIDYLDSRWSNFNSTPCTFLFRLYCFEE